MATEEHYADNSGEKELEVCEVYIDDYLNEYTTTHYEYDFKDIKGQLKAKKHWKLQLPEATTY